MPNQAYSTMPVRGAEPLKPVAWMGSSREDLRALHVFQKKSTRGIALPKHELTTIRERWRHAKRHHATHYHEGGKENGKA